MLPARSKRAGEAALKVGSTPAAETLPNKPDGPSSPIIRTNDHANIFMLLFIVEPSSSHMIKTKLLAFTHVVPCAMAECAPIIAHSIYEANKNRIVIAQSWGRGKCV